MGLKEYRNQNWSVAMTHFKKAVQLADDGPSGTFYERCGLVLEGQYEIPENGWDHCWSFD
jgi:hypothetical protein